jgi:hypothetical protein
MGLLKIDCCVQRTFKIIESSVEKLIKLEVRYEAKKALDRPTTLETNS